MFPGFPSRLLKEIQNVYVEKPLKNVNNKTIKYHINIIDSPRRRYSTFIGATVLANTYNNAYREEYWISKRDWDEVGPNIVLKKWISL